MASIKRIIAEDGEGAAQPPPRVRRGPVAVPDSPTGEAGEMADVTELESVEALAEPAPAPVPEAEEPASAVRLAPEPEPDVLELTSPMVAPVGWQPAAILSANAEQASRHAFAALSQARVEEEGPRGQTIEGFVAEMLRPMLSDWLDRELPVIVERIVTAEVRRLSGRG